MKVAIDLTLDPIALWSMGLIEPTLVLERWPALAPHRPGPIISVQYPPGALPSALFELERLLNLLRTPETHAKDAWLARQALQGISGEPMPWLDGRWRAGLILSPQGRTPEERIRTSPR